jgi:hypothetical protein
MPGQISENRLGAGKKQQKRIAKLGGYPQGLPAVKKQVRRAIYPPATNRTLNRPAPLLFAHTRQTEGFLFFRVFF